LRAALPDMRGSSSSLGREIELVRAWLAIVEIRWGGGVTFSAEAEQGLDHANVPPMTLLPVIASLVSADVQSRLALRLAATRDANALRIRIIGANIGIGTSAAGERLGATHERLRAIHGDNASASVETVAGETEIVVRIPFELETGAD